VRFHIRQHAAGTQYQGIVAAHCVATVSPATARSFLATMKPMVMATMAAFFPGIVVVSHGIAATVAAVDLVASMEVAATVDAAVPRVKRVTPPTGGRVGTTGLAGAKQSVATRIAVPWDEIVLVGVSGTAFPGDAVRNDRTVGLPKQAGLCGARSQESGNDCQQE
jgi:hypothetical protein